MGDFTLESLREFLESEGIQIADYGDDINGFSKLRNTMIIPLPPPCFWVRVESETDELLKFTASIMKLVWSKFERGQMEFSGTLTKEGNSSVTIKQAEDTNTGRLDL